MVLSACGITYELLVGAIAAYLLGGSVLQFSLTIGVFLASMGVGAYFSRFLRTRLLCRFVEVEIAVGIIGGVSGPLLFTAFTFTSFYYLAMFGQIVAIGALIGLEIPILTRYLQQFSSLRDSIANVFALDYLGSLFASFLFPLLLLPSLGIFRTSLAVGLLNLLVAFATLYVFRRELGKMHKQLLMLLLAALGLGGLLAVSGQTLSAIESKLYRDEVIFAKQSKYQRLVMTRYRDDVRLYLDGSLQFSSRDEYRYHESLVHPAMTLSASRENVLVIGGGDGLVLKQVLRYRDVKRAMLVDIDPAMTRLARTHTVMLALNARSLHDPRVTVRNVDAYKFLERSSELYSVIIIDLPDPRREALSKLYSASFYRIVERHLARGGVAVTQATSPLFARKAFWCIANTARSAGLLPLPYHTYVPSFGDWGFVLMSRRSLTLENALPALTLRYLSREILQSMVRFGKDQDRVPTVPSTLDKPVILDYYEAGWASWF
jgi:spermidine synthase